MCEDFQEVYSVFASISKISHKYRCKEHYVTKRLYQLCKDEKLYADEGFSEHINRYNIPTFEARNW